MTLFEYQSESDIASGVRRVAVDKLHEEYASRPDAAEVLNKSIDRLQQRLHAEHAIFREDLAELQESEPPHVTQHRAYWVGYHHGSKGHEQRPDGYVGECRTDYLMGWTNGRLHYVAGRADLSEHDANGEA